MESKNIIIIVIAIGLAIGAVLAFFTYYIVCKGITQFLLQKSIVDTITPFMANMMLISAIIIGIASAAIIIIVGFVLYDAFLKLIPRL